MFCGENGKCFSTFSDFPDFDDFYFGSIGRSNHLLIPSGFLWYLSVLLLDSIALGKRFKNAIVLLSIAFYLTSSFIVCLGTGAPLVNNLSCIANRITCFVYVHVLIPQVHLGIIE